MMPTRSLLQEIRRPRNRPLVRLFVVAVILGVAAAGVQRYMLVPEETRLLQADSASVAARQKVAERIDAQRLEADLRTALTPLPGRRDFAGLPLAVSEVARQDRVSMPTLSYDLGKPEAGGFSKAVLRGSVTGRYEDVRQFIHHLEAAEGYLFIDDLDVSRHGAKKDQTVTFHLTLSTYVRDEPALRAAAAEAR